jgi:hypothetical protein
MIIRHKKLIDSFAIIPHIDLEWIVASQFKLYYIRIAWLLWGVDIDIFYKINYD